MSYVPITEEEGKVFMKLYRKYLDVKYEQMGELLKTLPTDVIDRCFSGVEFFEEGFDTTAVDSTEFGFSGMCGYGKVQDVEAALEWCGRLAMENRLEKTLAQLGHKVNPGKVGLHKKEGGN